MIYIELEISSLIRCDWNSDPFHLPGFWLQLSGGLDNFRRDIFYSHFANYSRFR